jgi:ADP-heptose:LPS heptosyltransferase
LTNISCNRIAEDLLAQCLAGTPPDDLPPALLEEPCGQALFGIWVEGLADRFDGALCDTYTRLFAQAAAHAGVELDAEALVARYQRVRRPRTSKADPRRIYVLSRVTLGADVAVTSVLIATARRRFPAAELFFAGPRKNYELFAGDANIRHTPVEYRRGSLRERLAAAAELRDLFGDPDCLVIDPDSRLTQLGLLPVCAEERYHFFESRAYGGSSERSLPDLAASWADETFGVPGVKPFLCLSQSGRLPGRPAPIAINLGVGENPTKRIPDPFEEDLLSLLSETGQNLVIDAGAGGAEAERVQRAIQRSGVKATLWEGSFAGFASIITSSRLYVGYDSAGQHVAAACGVPLISIFAGFPSLRMFARWRPAAAHASVIRVDRPDPTETLRRVREAIKAHV